VLAGTNGCAQALAGLQLKKILLGMIGLVALGTAPATATDLATRPYTKAPPINR
jgi:hypothetical protein